MKINITYIISNIDKSLAFEWIAENINAQKYNLQFILLNPGPSQIEKYLEENNIPFKRINYFGKKSVFKATIQAYRVLKKFKTQIVHTHLFDANMVGLTAAKLAGVKKRIYTRHHSTFHHQYHPKAVKYDNYFNKKSTHIIAISETVKKVLIDKEKVDPSKICLVYHGFPLKTIENTDSQIVQELTKKYNPNAKHPVIGVISRYTEWKGIQLVIPAFKKLLKEFPDALLILANSTGDYKDKIKELLKTIPSENYIEIPFENNIFELYKLFDVFVHVPINKDVEAFGQIYVEALAAKIPSIFTLSGIANEFIKHNENALVVEHNDSDAIHSSILKLLNDKDLCNKLTMNGIMSIQHKFTLDKMILALEEIYAE